MRQWNSEQKIEIIRVEIIIARLWIGTQLTRSSFCHSLPNLIFVGTHEYFVNILNRLKILQSFRSLWDDNERNDEGKQSEALHQSNAEHDIAFWLDKWLKSAGQLLLPWLLSGAILDQNSKILLQLKMEFNFIFISWGFVTYLHLPIIFLIKIWNERFT